MNRIYSFLLQLLLSISFYASQVGYCGHDELKLPTSNAIAELKLPTSNVITGQSQIQSTPAIIPQSLETPPSTNRTDSTRFRNSLLGAPQRLFALLWLQHTYTCIHNLSHSYTSHNHKYNKLLL
jgi:hypothetical protein